MKPHPKGARARVLLTSVFGPHAQDDEFDSRSINPMELYHNQVTRAQGAFSRRMFHRPWGIMMIQANISAPSTVFDFATREAFVRELTAHDYAAGRPYEPPTFLERSNLGGEAGLKAGAT